MSRLSLAGTLAALVAFAVVLTWPQAIRLHDAVAGHNDPFSSIWRVSWIAHALRNSPQHLYDGNIFYPEPRTLAYTDAEILEGVVAAPLLWAGMPPLVAYNLLLLAGIAASGAGMFVLARSLTGDDGAALVAAAIFSMVPYRVEHFMHLELQWAAFIPLAFWAAHGAIDGRRWTMGLVAGVMVWLQVLACVYYGVFLAMGLIVLVVLLLATRRGGLPLATCAALAAGAVLAIALTAPFARPYVENAREFGPRSIAEVAQYSARPINYLASPAQNWLWGWTADRFGGVELRLFPGLIAVALALLGLVHGPRRTVWIYAAMCGIAWELSLGMHGPGYQWLFEHAWPLQGLRGLARNAILVYCALAVVAAFGTHVLLRRWPGRRRVTLAVILGALVVEYGSAPMFLVTVDTAVPPVYRFVRTLDADAVLVELPMPRPDRTPGNDPMYGYWSTTHWRRIVNGYGAFVSGQYVYTLERMVSFPDEPSLQRLRQLGARYVLIHERLYEPDAYMNMMRRVAVEPGLATMGRYRDEGGWTDVLEIRR